MRLAAGVIAFVALLSPITARAELNMQPGLWESIVSVGGNQMPPEQKCYLQKDIRTLDEFQRGISTPSQNPCKASNYRAIGNSMKYSLSCLINGQLTVSAATMIYDGTRITGQVTAVDGTITKIVNTRLGACTKSSFPD